LTVIYLLSLILLQIYCIGGIMVSVLATIAVDCYFLSRSDETKLYISGICCFSTKHPTLRCKSKDWLSRNHNHVS